MSANLRALVGAATPGVWQQVAESDGVYAGRRTVVRAATGGIRIVSVGQTRRHDRDHAEANVALIAALNPERVTALLDELDALAALVREGDERRRSAEASVTAFHTLMSEVVTDLCAARTAIRDGEDRLSTILTLSEVIERVSAHLKAEA